MRRSDIFYFAQILALTITLEKKNIVVYIGFGNNPIGRLQLGLRFGKSFIVTFDFLKLSLKNQLYFFFNQTEG